MYFIPHLENVQPIKLSEFNELLCNNYKALTCSFVHQCNYLTIYNDDQNH